jgi:hypothetical protein
MRPDLTKHIYKLFSAFICQLIRVYRHLAQRSFVNDLLLLLRLLLSPLLQQGFLSLSLIYKIGINRWYLWRSFLLFFSVGKCKFPVLEHASNILRAMVCIKQCRHCV